MVLGSCSMLGPIVERGNGVAVTTPVKVEEFSTISIPSSIDVVYTLSDEERSVVFTCDENLLDYYDIHVEGNTLVVDTKRGIISLSPKVRTVLTASAPVLEGVKVSGSGDCSVHGDIPFCDAFYLKCSGSGNITVDSITAGSIDASSSGSGDITINGITADSIKASVSGSGNIRLSGTAGSLRSKRTGSGIIESGSLRLPWTNHD